MKPRISLLWTGLWQCFSPESISFGLGRTPWDAYLAWLRWENLRLQEELFEAKRVIA